MQWGAQYVRDILPGEIIYTNENEPGKLNSYMVDEAKGKQRICSLNTFILRDQILH